MKVRNGFVSNSSSSSFVCITTLENHQRAIQNVHPYTREVLKQVKFEEKDFLGHKVIFIGDIMDAVSGYHFLDDVKVKNEKKFVKIPSCPESPDEAMYEYYEELKKDGKDKVFYEYFGQ